MSFDTGLQTIKNNPRTIICDMCGKEIVTIARLQKRCKPCRIEKNRQVAKEYQRRKTSEAAAR